VTAGDPGPPDRPPAQGESSDGRPPGAVLRGIGLMMAVWLATGAIAIVLLWLAQELGR
jgi:hypothetical protein